LPKLNLVAYKQISNKKYIILDVKGFILQNNHKVLAASSNVFLQWTTTRGMCWACFTNEPKGIL